MWRVLLIARQFLRDKDWEKSVQEEFSSVDHPNVADFPLRNHFVVFWAVLLWKRRRPILKNYSIKNAGDVLWMVREHFVSLLQRNVFVLRDFDELQRRLSEIEEMLGTETILLSDSDVSEVWSSYRVRCETFHWTTQHASYSTVMGRHHTPHSRPRHHHAIPLRYHQYHNHAPPPCTTVCRPFVPLKPSFSWQWTG